MVPLGLAALDFQPDRPAWPDFAACLLGAYRIRLRPLLDTGEARADYSDGDAGTRDYFYGDGSALHLENQDEGTRRGDVGCAAPEIAACLRNRRFNFVLR